jgi:Replication protein
MRRWLWKRARYQRCRDCGHKLRTAGDPTLRLSGTVGEDAVMGAAGTVTCAQRLCPPCAARIGRREAQQIADTLAVHRDTVYHPELAPYGLEGGAAVLVTLTLRHHLGQALVVLLAVLGYAWRQVVNGGDYAKIADEFGIVGWIRSLEITWSRVNGWHPHIHMLVLLNMAMSDDCAEELAWQLFLPWQRAVRRRGADSLEERGIDAKVCDLGDMSSGALGAYLSKIGHEVAGSHNKAGRVTDSFTIMGLLREVIDTYEEQVFRAWWELEDTIAGKRRKFLTWSHGAQELRARAGHGRRDKSDEELADEDMGSDDLPKLNS